MTQPELFDVVELLIDLPEFNLRAGIQGAIVEWYQLVVIGDREYRSTALALWLTKKKIDFVLRLNKNTKIRPRYKKYQALNSLDIKPGSRIIHQEVLVTVVSLSGQFH